MPGSETSSREEDQGSLPILPLIAFGIVTVLGLGLWVTTSGSENPGATDVPAASSIASPFALDEPQEVSTDVLQTKGVADWEITVTALADSGATAADDELALATFNVRADLITSTQTPVTTLESFDFAVVGGATSTTYEPSDLEEGCNNLDITAFDDAALLQDGDTVEGSICLAIDAQDIDHPDTVVALRFNLGEAAFFGQAASV